MGLSIYLNAQDLRFSRRTSERVGALSRTLRNLSAGVKTSAAELGGATLSINERVMSELQGTRAELRGLSSNASFLQTVDGALGEATESLQKMRALAVRASTLGLTFEDREALEHDFKALMGHIKSISDEATFNQRKILNGDMAAFQLSLVSDRDVETRAQAPKGDELALLPNLNPERLGQHVNHVGMGRGVFLSDLETGDLKINGVSIRGTTHFDDQLSYSYASGSALAKARAINAASELTGVTAEADLNAFRAYEPIVGATLNEERWIRVNGHLISGFAFKDQDATGALRQAMNAALAETGVIASVDEEGKLILAAPDGRNITIEFSDIPLRNQLAVRDLNGDEVNFSVDVDPPQYFYHGDISSVEYVTSNERVLETPPGHFTGSFTVLESKFTKPQDRVDYIFEVVKAGALGDAQFRVVEEQLQAGTSDDPSEDYTFVRAGAELAAPSPEKVRINGSQYQGASHVRVNLKVLTAGSPESSLEGERPKVEVYLTSLDDPTVAPVTLGQFTISNDETLDLTPEGLPIQLRFPIDERRSLKTSSGDALNLGQGLTPTSVADGHDYPLQPFIAEWDGIHSANVTIEVLEDGHGIGELAYQFVDEAPAKIRVTADLIYQGRTVVNDYSLDEKDRVYRTTLNPDGVAGDEFGGLGLVFPSPFGRQAITNSVTSTGDYKSRANVYPQRYVGEEPREYVITLTSDGIMSYQIGDGGPSAQVEVFGRDDANQPVLLDTYELEEVNTDRAIYLGDGTEKDGLMVVFPRGPRVTKVTKSRDPGGNLYFYSHLFNNLNPKSGVIRITRAGTDSSVPPAEWEYFYEDDPDTILGTGVIGKTTTFPDETRMVSQVQRSFVSSTSGVPSNTAFIRDVGYSYPYGGSFTSRVFVDPAAPEDEPIEDHLKLVTTWSLDNNTTTTSSTDFKVNTYLNIGHGIQTYFYRDRVEIVGGAQPGWTFKGQVSAQNVFKVGDIFSYEIMPNLANEGDTFEVSVSPVDLTQGTTWNLKAIGPDWKPGDTYAVDLGTGFNQPAQTLDRVISYGDTLGEIEINGSGRFEVGDQIRVGTRGFVGEAQTSGAYTNPAFPTEYVLTVTKAGEIDEAELSWVRADGLTDTEHGGSGVLSGLTEGVPAYIEEGVNLSIHDLGEGAYLAEGDEIRIIVGRNLRYTFGGQVTLHSRDPIDISFADDGVDQLLGRILFTGSEEEALSPKFTELSLKQAKVTARAESSLSHAGLMSYGEVNRALLTIDAALEELSDARAQLGSLLSRVEHQAQRLTHKVSELYGVTARLTGVDYAAETTSMSAEQIRLMSAPMLSKLVEVNAWRVMDLITLNGAR